MKFWYCRIQMLILTLFAFIAGIVTVLSPCILPVLPIVLSGSLTGGKSRPYGVITGFILSFTFFTLFLSTLVSRTGISANSLRLFSVIVIIGFGLSLLIPQMQVLLEKSFSFFSRFSPKTQKEGFFGGLLVGLSLGLIWTPCVGPILASIISLAISGTVTGSAVIITLAYSLGTAIPMMFIILAGQQALQKVPWLLNNTAKIQKGFGVVMVAVGLAIFFNLDRKFQTYILEAFPQYGTGLTRFEENEFVKQEIENLQTGETEMKTGQALFEIQDEMSYPKAPELNPQAEAWLNSEALTLEQLQSEGKVVLIDFWTYSCINCIRTLPFLTSWHEKYADRGLVIIGVHSPEFEFEKDAKNVIKAMADFDIQYPVVQDNDFAIWRSYENRYWPAKYLIDKNGKIRYRHFGEGKYTETENKIRELLGEETLKTNIDPTDKPYKVGQSPETYLGYERAKSYSRKNNIQIDRVVNYPPVEILPDNAVALEGSWLVGPESAKAMTNNAKLKLNFKASRVHLVLETERPGAKIKVLLDNQEVKEIEITEAKKYLILDLGEDFQRHELTLVFDEGIAAFAFTFGS